MKIAYLSTFYPYRGGIAQFNAALHDAFALKHEIKAFTFTTQYPSILFPGKTQIVEAGDNAKAIVSHKVISAINPVSFISAAARIKKYNPGIFITKFWLPFFGPSLGYVAASLQKRAARISILDNVIPHEPRLGDMSLIRYFLRRNDGFIVMSETVKNDLLKIMPDAKFRFHPHPLYDHFGGKTEKNAAREKLNLPQEKKLILCFGFIRDYKGIDLAIQAMNRLGNDYHLIIAGEVYGSFDKYELLIDQLGLYDKVSLFTRYISDEETALFFSAADVCLLPYKSATQSGIIAIAYHFDLPVLATDVGGLSEMITPYGAGKMIDKAQPESIAGALKEYFQSDITVFRRNIENYKRLASWDSLADCIIEFGKELKNWD